MLLFLFIKRMLLGIKIRTLLITISMRYTPCLSNSFANQRSPEDGLSVKSRQNEFDV